LEVKNLNHPNADADADDDAMAPDANLTISNSWVLVTNPKMTVA